MRYEYDGLDKDEVIDFYNRLLRKYTRSIDKLFAWIMALSSDKQTALGIRVECHNGTSTECINLIADKGLYIFLKRRSTYSGDNVTYVSHFAD